MHRAALRNLYGSNYPKTKSAAVVSPVVEDMDVFEHDNPLTVEEGNGVGSHIHVSLRRNSNNGSDIMRGEAVALKIHDAPEDTEYQLQRKSASPSSNLRGATVGMLSRFGVGQLFSADRSSNQEQDVVNGSRAEQKYTVLGQKHQWRKNRSGRSRQLLTISPVEDEDRPVQAEGGRYSPGRGSRIPSSIENTASSFCEDRTSSGRTSANSQRERTSSSDSNGRESEFAQGRSTTTQHSSSNAGGDGERFIITRQKKSKYSAKLHLRGQKPIYLGRYKNEAAALAACESAYSVIMTPRK